MRGAIWVAKASVLERTGEQALSWLMIFTSLVETVLKMETIHPELPTSQTRTLSLNTPITIIPETSTSMWEQPTTKTSSPSLRTLEKTSKNEPRSLADSQPTSGTQSPSWHGSLHQSNINQMTRSRHFKRNFTKSRIKNLSFKRSNMRKEINWWEKSKRRIKR